MAGKITNRFVHMTYNQYVSTTAFVDGSDLNYYKLNGQTADEAELVEYTGSTNGYTLIPPEAVVFVDFPDGTTGIITHLKFYSKLSELNDSGLPNVKVYEYSNGQYESSAENRLPTETYEDLGVKRWDVVAFVNTYTGVLNNFELAVCLDASTDTDSSGELIYTYTWKVVSTWPDSLTVGNNMSAGN